MHIKEGSPQIPHFGVWTLKQDTPSERAKHAGPFSEAGAAQDEKVEVPASGETPAPAMRPQVPHNTPADGLIPLKEVLLRSESTESGSDEGPAFALAERRATAVSSVSSHSSAAAIDIRCKLVALAKEGARQARHLPFQSSLWLSFIKDLTRI